jgi:REP element-mobilizing transposase RayT
MPRAPRIEFAGALYHVMNRGNHRQRIFADNQDREMFLATLAETCKAAGWVVHGFVLMPNHYHLLIETVRPTLVKGMQWLNSTYTLRYNARHKQRGHLFQGRYKALLVDGEEGDYFLTVSDYIHMNPARAKMVKSGEELLGQKWNSAGWLAGVVKGRPDWLRWERVYGELGMEKWGVRERKRFGAHMRRRVEEELGSGREEQGERWGAVREGWCYGSEGFRVEMRERMRRMLVGARRVEEKWSGASVGETEEAMAVELMGRAKKVLGYGAGEEVVGVDRYLVGRLVREQTRVGVGWLAGRMGMKTRGSLAVGLCLLGKRLESDGELQKRWKKVKDLQAC